MLGTKTVANAIFKASGRLISVSLFESIPESRTAAASSCAALGFTIAAASPYAGIPPANAVSIPRVMVAVSMIRFTAEMIEQSEIGTAIFRIWHATA